MVLGLLVLSLFPLLELAVQCPFADPEQFRRLLAVPLRQLQRLLHVIPLDLLQRPTDQVVRPGRGGHSPAHAAHLHSRVLGQIAHEVLEAAAVLEVVDPLLPDGRILTGPLPHDPRVPQDLPADLDARPEQRDP